MIDWSPFSWLFVYTGEGFDGPNTLSHSIRIGIGRLTIRLMIAEREK